MIQSWEDAASRFESLLTTEEREGAVVYSLEGTVREGTELLLPGLQLKAPAEAYVAFVDRQPTATWGHSARYILLGREDSASWSFEARFPPFAEGGERWRLVYRAPSVPDAAVAFPQ
jgi:hypothetical protein